MPRHGRADRVSALLRWCRAQGLRTERQLNGHWRVYTPAGFVVLSNSPKDRRAWLNARGLLRRYLRQSGWTPEQVRQNPL